MSSDLVDVHAHWLPTDLFGLPPNSPFGAMHDRDGELFLGDVPLSIRTEAMSDVDAIVADMDASGIAVRALSPPPFAFAVDAEEPAGEYTDSFNDALAHIVSDSNGRIVGLGSIRLDDAEAAEQQIRALAAQNVLAGIAIPPVLRGASLDTGVLRAVLQSASTHRMAVLVHPMQLPRPEWARYYLANLVGNPVETATAVASSILGGVLEELPELRLCFVHGGGCAPDLLGRWQHAWEARADVRSVSATSPRELFRAPYFDTVTHDHAALDLLRTHAGDNRVVCGTDYPFDMAEFDVAGFIGRSGLDRSTIAENGRAFLAAKVPADIAS
ncbi:amidohydrolase family protein [Rhodococcus sp. BP-252]|uniref:2-hydroxy-3-carboxy-6-oxo-7-methylocta-2, 4-dienoate decarboxylase n=1 Tax=Rhodococcoides kyotonense TaxID=398843 RepID=A0A177YJM9_9NOCA|nr:MULTISPECIES: amidohydrolase family protein [Rhodococcus]MBY6410669.1 amidohydrolase family protein [Rhodococcus sp. BP-320]MBY6415506.1 amidohydrolase family protein [Rhodococcus sp. BP-321]MBY6420121.1 amidohydrolase family protein [Rhodococcus sp. BP-324]MBY6425225.1 amidohydrolase family protein [Rhodococcus sp. BP-323]MBY6430712.1 amidohydrolase family protein [Rhodococcus sp. BP-322]